MSDKTEAQYAAVQLAEQPDPFAGVEMVETTGHRDPKTVEVPQSVKTLVEHAASTGKIYQLALGAEDKVRQFIKLAKAHARAGDHTARVTVQPDGTTVRYSVKPTAKPSDG